MTRGKITAPGAIGSGGISTATQTEAPEIHTGALLDKSEVQYVIEGDGSMTVTAPADKAGMKLTRRGDATKTTPGSLKLIGKPAK